MLQHNHNYSATPPQVKMIANLNEMTASCSKRFQLDRHVSSPAMAYTSINSLM